MKTPSEEIYNKSHYTCDFLLMAISNHGATLLTLPFVRYTHYTVFQNKTSPLLLQQ